jgi:hypothetical protein
VSNDDIAVQERWEREHPRGTVLEVQPITLHDRCDQCGHAAQVRVRKLDNPRAELLFCSHHTNANRRALKQQGWDYVI